VHANAASVFVYDAAKAESFAAMQAWMQDLPTTPSTHPLASSTASFVVIGNRTSTASPQVRSQAVRSGGGRSNSSSGGPVPSRVVHLRCP